MCGGSPLISTTFNPTPRNTLVVGEIHRRGDIIWYIRSPLSEPESAFIVLNCFLIPVGEIHRVEVEFITLVLPSLNRKFFCFLCGIVSLMSGRLHRSEYVFFNSRSPSYEPILLGFNGTVFWPYFLIIFMGANFTMTLGYVVVCIGGWGPYIVYI